MVQLHGGGLHLVGSLRCQGNVPFAKPLLQARHKVHNNAATTIHKLWRSHVANKHDLVQAVVLPPTFSVAPQQRHTHTHTHRRRSWLTWAPRFRRTVAAAMQCCQNWCVLNSSKHLSKLARRSDSLDKGMQSSAASYEYCGALMAASLVLFSWSTCLHSKRITDVCVRV